MKKKIDIFGKTKEAMEKDSKYEYVNHPSHYNHYDIEVIDRIWGHEKCALWCEITAFKYRMRMGTKQGEPIERDIDKEKFYLSKRDYYKDLLRKEREEKSTQFD